MVAIVMYDVHGQLLLAENYSVIVSRHARERFISRFRLSFDMSGSEAWQNTMICKIIKGGVRELEWEQSPFYAQKVRNVYGPTVVIKAKTKRDVYFILSPIRYDACILRTAVEKFDPRHLKTR